jgi:hypothetical protein
MLYFLITEMPEIDLKRISVAGVVYSHNEDAWMASENNFHPDFHD